MKDLLKVIENTNSFSKNILNLIDEYSINSNEIGLNETIIKFLTKR